MDGNPQHSSCAACGASVPSGARFCPACGAAQHHQADERRVVSVLFADIVGYTSLSEELDPEQAKRWVDECFQHLVRDIEAFGGRVDKIIGDAIVALFGAPTAHEDDAERAVRAGLRMIDTLRDSPDIAAVVTRIGRPIQMRVGVNTGEVLVGALQSGGDYTAMGDVVNTANRLQAMAEPGSVVVGGSTHAATADAISYEALGSVEVKGRAEPVDAYRAVCPVGLPGARRRRARVPMLGRDSELAIVRHAADNAFSRSRSQLVLLLGEPGMGKTRVAEEVSGVLQRRHDAHFLMGRCVPYGEANPWLPIAEAIRADLGIEPSAPADQVAGRVHEVVATWQESRAGTKAQLEESLQSVLGYRGSAPVDPDRARERELAAVEAYLANQHGDCPLVLVLADLQWAQAPIFELVDELFEKLSSRRLVVIATARPSVLAEWEPHAGRHNTLVLHLDPLDRVASEKLLSLLVDHALSAPVADTVLARAGGNPFYLEELVALLESTAEVSLDQLTVAEAEAILRAVPATLRGLAAARLDGLSAIERSVLSDAAVLGQSGQVAELATIARERKLSGFDTALRGLIEHEVLRVDDDHWEFRSEVVRNVAYETITKSDRAIRHGKIALWMEHHAPDPPPHEWVDALAYHYSRAAELAEEIGRPDDLPADLVERALRWLLVAADRAAGEANAVAARRYSTALNMLAEGDPRRVAVLAGRARARGQMGEVVAAAADGAEAAELARSIGDLAGQADALEAQALIAQWASEYETAIEFFDRSIAAWRAAGDRLGEATALRSKGLCLILAGDLDGAARSVDEAHDAFVALDDQRGIAWAEQHRAFIAYIEGRVDDADTRLHRSIEAFAALDDLPGMAWSLGLLAWVRFYQGRLTEADQLSARLLDEAATYGDRWAVSMMIVLRATISLWRGEIEAAIEHANEARGRFHQLNDGIGTVQSTAPLARSLIAAGEVDEGFELLDELSAISSFPGATSAFAPTSAISAAVHVGDVGRVARYRPADLDADVAPEVVGQGDLYVSLALADVMAGQVEPAVSSLSRTLERAEAEGSGLASYAGAALALALAANGDFALAVEHAERVRARPDATYLDRLMAGIGRLLGEAGLGQDIDASAKDLRAGADATGDRVMHGVVRLVEAAARRATGRPDEAAALADEAERRLSRLHVAADGWRRLVSLALGEPDRVLEGSA